MNSAGDPGGRRAPAPSGAQTLHGAAWMAVSVLCFAAMAVAGRELSSSMSTFELLFFRSLIGLAVLLPLALHAGGRAVATRRPGAHFWRNLIHFAGQYGFFIGVAMLPLVQLTALSATVPIFGVLLAALALRERLGPRRICVVLAGFAGALLILRPGWIPIAWPALAALAGSACYAWSSILVKSLSRTESPAVVVFQMQLMQLPMALVPALLDWTDPHWSDAPWLVVVALTGLIAHYAMTKALSLADAAVMLPVGFLQLPVNTGIGFVLYGEIPDMATIVGALVIFGATYAGIRQGASSPPAPRPPAG